MQPSDAKSGQVVRVIHLTPMPGILASPEHLEGRQVGMIGQVKSLTFLSDYDEQEPCIVWVLHQGKVAPYWNYELALVGVPYPNLM